MLAFYLAHCDHFQTNFIHLATIFYLFFNAQNAVAMEVRNGVVETEMTKQAWEGEGEEKSSELVLFVSLCEFIFAELNRALVLSFRSLFFFF